MILDSGTAKIQLQIISQGKTVGWYQRKESATYPPAYTNIEFAVGGSPVAETNPFVKVASQPDLWTFMGNISMPIRALGGLELMMVRLSGEKVGDYTGTVAFEYAVRMDDRVVDSTNSREFRVLNVKESASGTFKSLRLQLIP